MNFSENIRTALHALAANKLRSGLTMLGIVIGVGAVVALMAIGTGASATITEQVQGIGSNLIVVIPGRIQAGAMGGMRLGVLYYNDYTLLARNLDNIAAIAPFYQSTGAITYGKKNINSTVYATTPAYAVIRNAKVAKGRFLTDNDRANKSHVAVIGSQTAKDLFGGVNPVGRTFKIGGVPFQVVGLLEAKGGGSMGNSEDDVILVPLETGYEKLYGAGAIVNGRRRVTGIYVSAASPEAVDPVMAQIERLLRRQHKLKLTDKLDFTVLSQAQFLDILGVITSTLTSFLVAIGVISLIVGGIGVMNIMLVSVTERTREIGLRKALGAKQSTILAQFLIETVTLCFFGGALGIGVGWLIAQIMRWANIIQAQVTPDAVAAAFGVTALVGIVFGLYPAYRAARLRPIEALRYE